MHEHKNASTELNWTQFTLTFPDG